MSVEPPILKQGGAGTPDAELIKNTTTKDFMRDVVEASREVPVLVDFWAPWCGPCRQLTPILEKAVRAAKGAVRLVKLNIDEHPQIPGQMGVQSIPAVFAFQDGRPVDGFMGALPESRVNAFIARLMGDKTADTASDLEARRPRSPPATSIPQRRPSARFCKRTARTRRRSRASPVAIKTGDLARAPTDARARAAGEAESAPGKRAQRSSCKRNPQASATSSPRQARSRSQGAQAASTSLWR
jgi:putative thioredoxin